MICTLAIRIAKHLGADRIGVCRASKIAFQKKQPIFDLLFNRKKAIL